MKNSDNIHVTVTLMNDNAEPNQSHKEKADKYFVEYANKVSRMNGWKTEEELARKLVILDELNEDDESQEERKQNELKEKTMREIEILQAHKEKTSPPSH